MKTMKVKVWYRPEIACVEVEVDEAHRRVLDDDLTLNEYEKIIDVLCDEAAELLPADADYITAIEVASTGELIVEC